MNWPWCWHRFGKWKITKHGDLQSGDSNIGIYVSQKRECLKCGLLQMRDVKLT